MTGLSSKVIFETIEEYRQNGNKLIPVVTIKEFIPRFDGTDSCYTKEDLKRTLQQAVQYNEVKEIYEIFTSGVDDDFSFKPEFTQKWMIDEYNVTLEQLVGTTQCNES